jgi:hypothetical protein
MAKVLKVDCSTGGGDIKKNFGTNYSEAWLYADVALDSTALADLLTAPGGPLFDIIQLSAGTFENCGAEWYADTGPVVKWAAYNNGAGDPASTPFAPSPVIAAMQFYRVKLHVIAGTPITQEVWIDGVSIGTITVTASHQPNLRILDLFQPGLFIAFDDGPLEPSPTWTCHRPGRRLPPELRLRLRHPVGPPNAAQPDRHRHSDRLHLRPRAGPVRSPQRLEPLLREMLDGKQILLKLWDPEAGGVGGGVPRPDRRHHLGHRRVSGRRGRRTDQRDDPDRVRRHVRLPRRVRPHSRTGRGHAAVCAVRGTAGGPPAGFEDGVYYAQTAGTVDDRIIEILTDVGIDSTRYTVASGNVSVKAVKYDPDESALQALRDAADAELPFIANIYCDRHGDFLFRGRYSRFDPDAVAAEPGSTWDFTRWAVGDGAAIIADPTRAQIRSFAFGRQPQRTDQRRDRYPQGMVASPDAQPGVRRHHLDHRLWEALGAADERPAHERGQRHGSGFTTTDVQECFLFAKLTGPEPEGSARERHHARLKAIRRRVG